MPKHYRVYYRSQTDSLDKWMSIDTEDIQPFLTIRNLSQKGMAYIFKVKAVTDVGEGLESKESDWTVMDMVGQKLMCL